MLGLVSSNYPASLEEAVRLMEDQAQWGQRAGCWVLREVHKVQPNSPTRSLWRAPLTISETTGGQVSGRIFSWVFTPTWSHKPHWGSVSDTQHWRTAWSVRCGSVFFNTGFDHGVLADSLDSFSTLFGLRLGCLEPQECENTPWRECSVCSMHMGLLILDDLIIFSNDWRQHLHHLPWDIRDKRVLQQTQRNVRPWELWDQMWIQLGWRECASPNW